MQLTDAQANALLTILSKYFKKIYGVDVPFSGQDREGGNPWGRLVEALKSGPAIDAAEGGQAREEDTAAFNARIRDVLADPDNWPEDLRKPLLRELDQNFVEFLFSTIRGDAGELNQRAWEQVGAQQDRIKQTLINDSLDARAHLITKNILKYVWTRMGKPIQGLDLIQNPERENAISELTRQIRDTLDQQNDVGQAVRGALDGLGVAAWNRLFPGAPLVVADNPREGQIELQALKIELGLAQADQGLLKIQDNDNPEAVTKAIAGRVNERIDQFYQILGSLQSYIAESTGLPASKIRPLDDSDDVSTLNGKLLTALASADNVGQKVREALYGLDVAEWNSLFLGDDVVVADNPQEGQIRLDTLKTGLGLNAQNQGLLQIQDNDNPEAVTKAIAGKITEHVSTKQWQSDRQRTRELRKATEDRRGVQGFKALGSKKIRRKLAERLDITLSPEGPLNDAAIGNICNSITSRVLYQDPPENATGILKVQSVDLLQQSGSSIQLTHGSHELAKPGSNGGLERMEKGDFITAVKSGQITGIETHYVDRVGSEITVTHHLQGPKRDLYEARADQAGEESANPLDLAQAALQTVLQSGRNAIRLDLIDNPEENVTNDLPEYVKKGITDKITKEDCIAAAALLMNFKVFKEGQKYKPSKTVKKMVANIKRAAKRPDLQVDAVVDFSQRFPHNA